MQWETTQLFSIKARMLSMKTCKPGLAWIELCTERHTLESYTACSYILLSPAPHSRWGPIKDWWHILFMPFWVKTYYSILLVYEQMASSQLVETKQYVPIDNAHPQVWATLATLTQPVCWSAVAPLKHLACCVKCIQVEHSVSPLRQHLRQWQRRIDHCVNGSIGVAENSRETSFETKGFMLSLREQAIREEMQNKEVELGYTATSACENLLSGLGRVKETGIGLSVAVTGQQKPTMHHFELG